MNAKPKEVREKKEEAPVQEDTPVVEAPKEEAPEVKAEETDNFGERRWKKKKIGETEEKKEDLLVRPENALNYAEYLQQLKEKNQNLQIAPKKTIEVVNSDLKPQVKEGDLTIGIGSGKRQQKPKPKDKKDETLDVVFQTGDDNERRYDNRENTKNYGKKKGPKFQYKTEDFPEL